MPRVLSQALIAMLTGACAGALALGLFHAWRPALVLELDRDLPGYTSGFYPVERNGDTTFAWTSADAVVRLRGLDRRAPWQCTVRLQGARPASTPAPLVHIGADGVVLATLLPPPTYQDIEVTIPPRPTGRGLTVITLTTTPTFVPSASDRRALGVQVDRISCRREGLALPPSATRAAAALAGAIFGAAISLMGFGWPVVAAVTLPLAVLQAIPLTAGPAPYGPYPSLVPWLAAWIAGIALLVVQLIEWGRGRPLRGAARAAVALSGVVLFLKLLALLHPLKLAVDVMFHAHRLEWVLAGRYFFVQPMPDGVGFPYAIALYVIAAPWTHVTTDYAALLRIVVCVTEAAAALLLYPAVASAWGRPRAALAAVLLVQLVPLPYVTVGNANLTFAFGAAAALITMATATAWPPGRRELALGGLLCVLASIALLSHVGIVALLMVTLAAMAGLYWWRGGHALRRRAWVVLAAATVAAILSVVTYYGHFGEVYEKLGRVVGGAPAATSPAPAQPREAAAPAGSVAAAPAVPVRLRAGRALSLAIRAFGWPIACLALLGAWRAWREGRRDRLTLTLVASGLTGLAFVLATVLAPVEARFVRYADEFIDRAYYVTAPAVAVFAATGAEWAWSRGLPLRVLAVVLCAAAAAIGWAGWLAWIR